MGSQDCSSRPCYIWQWTLMMPQKETMHQSHPIGTPSSSPSLIPLKLLLQIIRYTRLINLLDDNTINENNLNIYFLTRTLYMSERFNIIIASNHYIRISVLISYWHENGNDIRTLVLYIAQQVINLKLNTCKIRANKI